MNDILQILLIVFFCIIALSKNCDDPYPRELGPGVYDLGTMKATKQPCYCFTYSYRDEPDANFLYQTCDQRILDDATMKIDAFAVGCDVEIYNSLIKLNVE